MVCIKKLNVIGGEVSNLTIGKQYNISVIPIALNESDEMQEPLNPKVMVWGDDISSDYQYPMEAFVTLDEYRQIQLGKLDI
jgi:hypothetical protein